MIYHIDKEKNIFSSLLENIKQLINNNNISFVTEYYYLFYLGTFSIMLFI